MHPRNLLIITLFALCHVQLSGQALTNALPASSQQPSVSIADPTDSAAAQLPDDFEGLRRAGGAYRVSLGLEPS